MRSIRRSESCEALFKRFTESAHPISSRPVFSTQRDFLCFLAVLGFHVGRRTPLQGKTLELDSRVFDSNEQSRDLIYLVALASEKDANILQPEREDDLARVFEEYVCTGFCELQNWLNACPDDHIGDQAILSAIRREGFFGHRQSQLEDIINEVEF